MSLRLIRVRESMKGKTTYKDNVEELWHVLSDNYRTVEFEGSLIECQEYLKLEKLSCPTGGCE